MPGIKIPIRTSGPLTKNLLTTLALLGCITLLIFLIYIGQSIFYRQAFHPVIAMDLHKITGVTRENVFDLSGSEASGYGDPMKLFDENADPANGVVTFPHTQPLPTAKTDLFYPAGKGLRVVVDLHDQYALKGFYLYDRSLAADSVWVYTGSMQHWQLAAAYKTSGNPAAWGWRSFVVRQDARFVMIRFNSPRSVISELVMYGDIKKKLASDAVTEFPALPSPTLAAFAGTNVYDAVPPDLLSAFQSVRLYQMMEWYDTDTVHAYPKNQITLNYFHQEPAEQLRSYADSLRRHGNSLWISMRGLPKSMVQHGFQEKDKPVTLPGMDTEDPLSYGRHAKTYWNLAAVFGQTVVDTSLLDIRDVPKFSGLGLMNRFENGNEEDAYWTKYFWTPMDYFAVSSADYDGHEGRLGNKHGLNKADSSCQLMASGMIQLDTNRVRTLNFLCRTLRTDKKFIWKAGVQYHYYSNDAVDNSKPPTKGISPEEDHMRAKLARVRAFHDKLLPGIPLILGENGYDRNQSSWQRTPLLPGYSAAQSQGIMCIRSLLAAFMAGFNGYNQFMMRDASNDTNATGVFATSGLIGGPAGKTIYPGWYYWSALIHQLGNFQPDGIVSESGPVWTYRLKDKKNPARKAWVLFSPTVNGTIIQNFSFNPGDATNQSFTELSLSDNNLLGNVRHRKFLAGSLNLMVGESPVVLVTD